MNHDASKARRRPSPMRQAVERLERKLIVQALHEGRGRLSAAARWLGVSERVLRYKIKKYRLVVATKLSVFDKNV